MGAWGSGNFENDTARDWLADAPDLNAVRETLAKIVGQGEGTSANTNACVEALAACELVAGALGAKAATLPPEADAWIATYGSTSARADAVLALDAVARIDAHSSLQRLFDDGERHEAWHSVTSELRARLAKLV